MFIQKGEKWDEETQAWVTVAERVYTKKVATQAFTMLLHPAHAMLYRLTHIKDFHALIGLCELCEFNTNKVFIQGSRRQELMALTGQTTQHLSNSLRRLREAGLIAHAKCEVTINPRVLWKGSSHALLGAVAANAPDAIKTVKSDFAND